MHERGISAYEINPYGLCRIVQRLTYQGGLFGKRRANKAGGRYGNALVYYGNAVLPCKPVRNLYDIFGRLANKIVNGLSRLFRSPAHAGQQRQPHRHRSDIEMLSLNHIYSFQNFVGVKHLKRPIRRAWR